MCSSTSDVGLKICAFLRRGLHMLKPVLQRVAVWFSSLLDSLILCHTYGDDLDSIIESSADALFNIYSQKYCPRFRFERTGASHITAGAHFAMVKFRDSSQHKACDWIQMLTLAVQDLGCETLIPVIQFTTHFQMAGSMENVNGSQSDEQVIDVENLKTILHFCIQFVSALFCILHFADTRRVVTW